MIKAKKIRRRKKYVGKRNDNKDVNKERKLFDKVRIGQNSESSAAESSSF